MTFMQIIKRHIEFKVSYFFKYDIFAGENIILIVIVILLKNRSLRSEMRMI